MTDTKEAVPAILVELAESYSMSGEEAGRTLMNTIFPGGKATGSQLMAFAVVAKQYGLNPWTKEIYAFPAKGGGVIPVVSVDGWYKMMNEHPQFDGIETSFENAEDGSAISCTCSVYRKDRNHPVTVTEYLAECSTGSPPWRKAPRRMLRHRAITQAARIAFSFAGIYEPDEAARIVDIEEERPSPQLQNMQAMIEAEATPAAPTAQADMFAQADTETTD